MASWKLREVPQEGLGKDKMKTEKYEPDLSLPRNFTAPSRVVPVD